MMYLDKTFYIIAFILSVINIIYAKEEDNISTTDKKIDNNDQYYLIFVNNTHGEYQIFSDTENHKRQESQVFIESLANEINDLIISNKDTFQNPGKVEEIENNFQSRKRKRNFEDENIYNYDESELVYPISSVNNRVVLLAFLSEDLVEKVQKMENIIACEPNLPSFTTHSHPNFDISEIMFNSYWNNVRYQENADFHLSLISQGMYNKNLVNQYDNTYYYPSTAGKDVNIVILDTSFNFDYSEFKNSKSRITECSANIKNGKARLPKNKKSCGDLSDFHGQEVSDVIAGAKHGVAKEANVYGVTIYKENNKMKDADILAGLQYILDHLIQPNKTVINISIGGFEYKNEKYDHYSQLIQQIHEKKAIVVAAAGNESTDVVDESDDSEIIPCALNHVICVGAIDNSQNKMMENVYKRADFSNFGDRVDLYAPSFITSEVVEGGKPVISRNDGTSYSTSIVTGIIATQMSNIHEVYKSYKDIKDIIYFLNLITLHNVITDPESDGITYNLANNGKHIVYSKDNIYHGCGTLSGNRPCSKNKKNNRCGPQYGICNDTSKCCSQDGYCGTSDDHCGVGCQSEFGSCSSSHFKPYQNTLDYPISLVPGRCGRELGKCSGSDECCSSTGYCGQSLEFCGLGCQSEFGKCSTSPSTSTTSSKTTTSKSILTTSIPTSLPTLSPSPPSKSRNPDTKKIPISTDPDKCGPQYGKCADPNECCSQYGYCGTTTEHCGKGCQSEFGNCSLSPSSSPTSPSKSKEIPISTDPDRCGPEYGKCAHSNECCSKYNYCGTSPEHCGKGCQSEFGQCSSPTTTNKPTKTTKKIPVSTVSGRCGPKYGRCPKSNECCSKHNYCGTKIDYCGKGCQSEFGKCN